MTTQISILKGIYTDESANYRTSLPVNMFPVVTENGISNGYLRSAPGIDNLATGPGEDRGAFNWRNFCYRVMGSRLVRLSGATVTDIGDVSSGGTVRFDNSLDRLAIASGGGLYYYDGATLSQVTDPDLGTVLDVVWIDGYFMTTDGQFLVVTELNDPFAVNPLKYGASDASPDNIVALMKIRNEVYAVNETTTENFQNVGGSGFPFRRNPGGLIPKGAVGTHAVAYFLDTFAFVGNGIDEAPSVWLAQNGTAGNLSTPEVDREIQAVAWDERYLIEVEAIQEQGEQRLLVHLPTKTLVYHHQATLAAETPVWTILAGGVFMDESYPGRHFAYVENRWTCGNVDGRIGYLWERIRRQFGEIPGFQFDTVFLFNEGKGAKIKRVNLPGLPGRSASVANPTMFLSWTQNGQTWSQEREISYGSPGQRDKRMEWRPKIRMRQFLSLRVRGAAAPVVSFARMDLELEPLNG